MGLYYTALERAEREAEHKQPAAGESVAAAPAPQLTDALTEALPAAVIAPVSTWQEAEQRDLAGYPLAVPASEPMPEPAPQPGTWMGSAAAWDAASLGAEANQTGAAKEQYRILRTRLLEAMISQNLRTLLITSTEAGEGKTMVAANLALQLSSLKESRVLLIDADLRRAGLSSSLRPRPRMGLSDYLKGEAGLSQVLCEINPWLTILPTRTAQEEGPELLAHQGMAELLQRAREHFDLVLVDGAPVMPVADSRILAGIVDASLLVVRAQTALTGELERAAEMLRPRLLGSVLNGVKEHPSRYGYYSETEPAAAPEVNPELGQ